MATLKFSYGGRTHIITGTPEEVSKTFDLTMQTLKRYEEHAAADRVFAKYGGPMAKLRAFVAEEADTPWTPEVFLSFLGRLGGPQQKALATLVLRHRLADAELRRVLGVTNNQALAGVLSGISKQAAALDIPARAIFSFENIRNAGKRRSTYAIADKFLQIASEMNWPGPEISRTKINSK